jgi:hypothetical protein
VGNCGTRISHIHKRFSDFKKKWEMKISIGCGQGGGFYFQFLEMGATD